MHIMCTGMNCASFPNLQVFPGGSAVKNLPVSAGDTGLILGPIRKRPRRRKWQPTTICLPKKFHGQRNLAGYSPWGHKESDITEHTRTTHTCVVRSRDNIGVLITFGGIDLCGSSDSIQEDGMLKIHIIFSIKLQIS